MIITIYFLFLHVNNSLSNLLFIIIKQKDETLVEQFSSNINKNFYFISILLFQNILRFFVEIINWF